MKTNSNYIKIILIRLIKTIFKLDLSSQIGAFLNTINDLRMKSGLSYTIKYLKASRLHIVRYICGKPLLSNSSGVSVDKEGFPTKFIYLKKILKVNKQAVLTLLTYSRYLTPSKKEYKYRNVNLESITGKYTGKDYTIPKSFIQDFVKKFDLSTEKHNYSSDDHYVSVKGSPNGKSSYTSWWSVLSLSSNLLDNIKYLTGESYFTNIVKHILLIRLNYYDQLDQKKLIPGKLAVVHDPELKERVIAMVDYTTQFILRPIHDQLLKNLSKLPCDRTFTQDPYHTWKDDSNNFYSLDLSSATDRFPIFLQQKLLSLIYNDYNYAKNWRGLLVDRCYQYGDQQLKYAVGQPMGAYTSWAAFTLTHHLVVHWAAHLCGFNDFNDYIILGDDIVIKNNKVAQKYITLMTRWGVDISQPKTFVSGDTYEFAKRIIKNKSEITGISLRGILSNLDNIFIVYMNIYIYFERQPQWFIKVSNLIGELYKGLHISSRCKSRTWYINRLYDFDHSIRYSLGLLTYEEIRNYFHNKFKSIEFYTAPSEKLIPSVMKEILSLGMVDTSKNLVKHLNRQLALAQGANKPAILKIWPLIQGYRNHIGKLETIINKVNNGEVFDLVTIVRDLNLQNLDKVLSFKRNSLELISPLDKLWRSSFTLYLKQLQESVKPEVAGSLNFGVPKTMASNMWGNVAKHNFTSTYKSKTIGVKSWNSILDSDIKYLNTQLALLCEDRSNPKSNDLRPQIWDKYITSTRENKPISFD